MRLRGKVFERREGKSERWRREEFETRVSGMLIGAFSIFQCM